MKIHPYYFSAQKRSLDIILSVILLILTSPLIFLIGMLVFITVGQPIIFRQTRTGKNGQPFTLVKFRTMSKNATMLKRKYQHLNEAPAPMFKIRDDPRYVGLGKWLARTGLDELPQLWNILKGEMSFVGPRPLPTHEAESLPSEWRKWREMVNPGIFSQWAFSKEKHQSLKKWQELENKTLEFGSIKDDIQYVLISVKIVFAAVLKH